MYRSIQPPHYCEGFDKIEIIRNSIDYQLDKMYGKMDWEMFYERYRDYDQDNSHHELTLGNHCRKALEYIRENYYDDIVLQTAAMFHDIGKPYTCTYTNKKGERSKEAHYYEHNNVGSYIVFFCDTELSDRELLDVSLLINMHMNPYTSWSQSEKAKEKDRRLIGEELFQKLEALHEADVYAH